MGQKLRRMVMKRAKLCDLVVSATKVQGPGVGEELGSYLSPTLAEGESLPDLATPIELYGRRLRGYRDVMVATDARYYAELAALVDLKAESEVPAGVLKELIKSLRATCVGLLGEDSLRSLALDFNLAQEPAGVLRQAEIIRQRLRAAREALTPERWVEASLDPTALAASFDESIAELRRALARVFDQRKRVDTAKVRKDRALEEFDRNFVPLARLIEATFRVAGETEMADRIRPTVRQLGRDDGSDDGGEEEENEEAASSEPASDTDSDSGSGSASASAEREGGSS